MSKKLQNLWNKALGALSGGSRVDGWGSILDAPALTPGMEGAYSGRLTSPQAAREILARSGLAGRIVWGPVGDALARGWATDADGATTQGPLSGQDISRDLDLEIGTMSALHTALGCARADGGAWIWLASPNANYASPMPEGAQITRLQALTAAEVDVLSIDPDPSSKTFGEAAGEVVVRLKRRGFNLGASNPRIHTSWLVYVPGSPMPPDATPLKLGYDQSTLELYIRAIANLDGTGYSVSRLLDRLSMPWLRIVDGEISLSSDEAPEFEERLRTFKDAMTASGLMLLTGQDEVGWTGPTLAGLRDGVTLLYEALTVPEGIPLSKLFGQAPGGLSTDDKSGQRTYDAFMARYRTLRIDPVLLKVYEKIWGPDSGRKIRWPELSPLSAQEEADISLKRAQRDAILIDKKVITEAEARTRFEGNEEVNLPELQQPQKI